MRGKPGAVGGTGRRDANVIWLQLRTSSPTQNVITTEKLSSRPEQNEPQSGSFCEVEGPASLTDRGTVRNDLARADFTSVREKPCPLNKSGSPLDFANA